MPATRGEVERVLAENKLKYQRVELPHGLVTPGKDRRPTAKLVLPENLEGRDPRSTNERRPATMAGSRRAASEPTRRRSLGSGGSRPALCAGAGPVGELHHDLLTVAPFEELASLVEAA